MDTTTERELTNRRDFVRQTSSALFGLTIVPSTVISGLGHVAPSDLIN